MSEPDELFTLRTLFWLGNYQGAISEASTLNRINPSLKNEKSEFVYRAYIGLGQYAIPIDEIRDNPNTTIGLRAIKLLASYQADRSNKEIVLLQLNEWLNDPVASGNTTLQLIAATIFVYEDSVKDAYQAIKNGVNIEQYALLVQLHIRINRLDLAQKVVKQMKAADDDSVLTQVANASVNLTTGDSSKYQEAAYAYEELIDKYGGTSLLFNGFAIAKILLGQFEEAESTLQESLAKSPTDPDTLANMITAAYHLQKPDDIINRYVSQLKLKAPNHPMVTSLATFSSAFDRVSAGLK